MPAVEIIISADGQNIEIEGIDYEDSSCEQIEQALLSALGDTITETKKPEYQNKVLTREKERAR